MFRRHTALHCHLMVFVSWSRHRPYRPGEKSGRLNCPGLSPGPWLGCSRCGSGPSGSYTFQPEWSCGPAGLGYPWNCLCPSPGCWPLSHPEPPAFRAARPTEKQKPRGSQRRLGVLWSLWVRSWSPLPELELCSDGASGACMCGTPTSCLILDGMINICHTGTAF